MGKCVKATSDFVLVKDHIDQLPDEILISILSKLTLKEAGKTSILSRRWRYLWMFFSGNMDFDAVKPMKRIQLVSQINQVFELHKGLKVERFRIKIDNNIRPEAEDIDNWIELAAKKHVKKFVLRFGYFNVRSYSIPSRFLTCLSFESLKALRLDSIRLNNEVWEFFLSKSPNLVTLWLSGSPSISKLLVPSSSLKLKFLLVWGCENLGEIEICARSLEKFTYFGAPINILVKYDVKCLHTFYGAGPHAMLSEGMTHLCRSLPLFQLENLYLDLRLTDSYDPLEIKQVELPKLKELHLQITPCEGDEMLNCLHLLEAAPILHTLTIEFAWRYLDEVRKGSETFDRQRMRPIPSLKVVKIIEFMGRPASDALLVKTLLENYVLESSLEKLMVAPFRRDDTCEISGASNKEVEDNIALLFQNGVFPAGTVIDSSDQLMAKVSIYGIE